MFWKSKIKSRKGNKQQICKWNNIKKGSTRPIFYYAKKTTVKFPNNNEAAEIPKITKISFGNYLIDTWYIAPYTEECNRNVILYICEYCMRYIKSSFIAKRYQRNVQPSIHQEMKFTVMTKYPYLKLVVERIRCIIRICV